MDLKHIFFIHSPITLITSLAVISYLGLPKNQVIFVCLSTHKKNIDLNLISEYKIKILPRDQNRIFKNKYLSIIINSYEKYFYAKKIIKNYKYYFYTPHDFFNYSEYFSNNINCKGYFYIEEGFAAYNKDLLSPYKEVNNKSRLLKLIPKSNFIKSNLFSCFPNLKGSYSITNKAFNFINNTINVKNELSKIIYPTQKFNSKYIIILDNLISSNYCDFNDFIDPLINYIKLKNIRKFNVKFHPFQPQDEINKIIKEFKDNNFEFNIIPNNIILEMFLINQDYICIGYTSSLLIYNKLLSTNGLSISLANINKIKEEYQNDVNMSIEIMKKLGIEMK